MEVQRTQHTASGRNYVRFSTTERVNWGHIFFRNSLQHVWLRVMCLRKTSEKNACSNTLIIEEKIRWPNWVALLTYRSRLFHILHARRTFFLKYRLRIDYEWWNGNPDHRFRLLYELYSYLQKWQNENFHLKSGHVYCIWDKQMNKNKSRKAYFLFWVLRNSKNFKNWLFRPTRENGWESFYQYIYEDERVFR